MVRCLELFSGTGSIGKCCKELGIETLSIDIDGRADITISILDWDYKTYPKDSFDVIWASPPCASFSKLQDSRIGRTMVNGGIFTRETQEENMKSIGDPLVKKALEIIAYFEPELWFMENPQTGKLKSREYMKSIPFYDVSYCMYSDWGYRKNTRIWTNKQGWTPLKCDGSGACGYMVGAKHVVDMSRDHLSLDQKYSIPPNLIYSLLLE
tara:strand:+ start:2855 stop:3484 length:630 start_codon:yes stop_codon:yes gene_type:complete